MGKRHTNQEWQTLIEQSESSSLSTLAFCKLKESNPSTFMPSASNSTTLRFRKASLKLKSSKRQPSIKLQWERLT